MRTPTLFCAAALLCALAPSAQAALAKLPSGRSLPWGAGNPAVVGNLQSFLQTPAGTKLIAADPSLSGLLKVNVDAPLQTALMGAMTAQLPETLTPETVLAAHKEASVRLQALIQSEANEIITAVSAGNLRSAKELESYAKDLSPFGVAWPGTAESVGRVAQVAKSAKADKTMSTAKSLAESLLAGLRQGEGGAIKQSAGAGAHGSQFQAESQERQAARELTAKLKAAKGSEHASLVGALGKLAQLTAHDNVRELVIAGLGEDAATRTKTQADRLLLIEAYNAIDDITGAKPSYQLQEARIKAWVAVWKASDPKDVGLQLALQEYRTFALPTEAPFRGLKMLKGPVAAAKLDSLARAYAEVDSAYLRPSYVNRFFYDARDRHGEGDRANVILALKHGVALAAATPEAAVKDSALTRLEELLDTFSEDDALIELIHAGQRDIERSYRQDTVDALEEKLRELALSGSGTAGSRRLIEAITEQAGMLGREARKKAALNLLDAAEKDLYTGEHRRAIHLAAAAAKLAATSPSIELKDVVLKHLGELREQARRVTNIFGVPDEELVLGLLLDEAAIEHSYRDETVKVEAKPEDDAAVFAVRAAAQMAAELTASGSREKAQLAVIRLGALGEESRSARVKELVLQELQKLLGPAREWRSLLRQKDYRVARAVLIWQAKVERSFRRGLPQQGV